jgi:cardiolipin synthase
MHFYLLAYDWAAWSSFVALSSVLAHFALQIGIAVRVVMRRRSTGETMSWILVTFTLPIVGPLLYLLVGELRLGRRRERRFVELMPPIKQWLADIPTRSLVDWSRLEDDYEPLSILCERTIGVPSLVGNHVELINDWQHVFERLLADIAAAEHSCHLEFYIWNVGGEADRVADALIRAQQRGVVCRVLVDAMGSRSFVRSDVAERMRAAGITILDALPGGLLRMPFVRFDLRLHRKIVVIDGRTAYTGSLNLVDPRFFKRDAGVGQWVDAMVRVEGPAVEALQITFLADWYVESNVSLDEIKQYDAAPPQPKRGDCAVQVMPSGPELDTNSVEQVLLTAIYSARQELVITTPYFVPSESLMMGLVAAARRGVKVVLIVPKHVDSMLVRHASGAFKGDLLEAGVRVALFGDGLLHTKSVTVDRSHCLFGSVNMDPRSFRLNFEILLAIYNRDFTSQLCDLQQHYIDRSELMDLETYRNRPRRQQVAENFARLLGPLL